LKLEQESKSKAESEAKALEAAKAIVLTEDSSLPKAQTVSVPITQLSEVECSFQ